VLGLAGCATGDVPRYGPDELRELAARYLAEAFAAHLEIPYEVDAAWIERARELAGRGRPSTRARRLAEALQSPDGFNLLYHPVSATTARETFANGYGNCLALSSVFVGLARGIGLDAYYIDASERHTEVRHEEEFAVSAGHVAAAVRTESGYMTVDFDGELAHFGKFDVLHDMQAVAHFYNNRGYERLDAAIRDGAPIPWEEARASFETAAMLVPTFALASNNLGIAYRRLGAPDLAERHFREAIARDDGFAAPYSNLGKLQLERGELVEAIASFEQAIGRDRTNPYFRFNLAVALHHAGQLERAHAEAERAAKLDPAFAPARELAAEIARELAARTPR
jgi:tetratricopeptide (TPR) repeat protein